MRFKDLRNAKSLLALHFPSGAITGARAVEDRSSSRDLVQMMAERGIASAHTTIFRWVQQYVPDFEKRCEAVRLAGGRFLAPGRNVPQGAWPMGLSVPRGGSPGACTVDFLLE